MIEGGNVTEYRRVYAQGIVETSLEADVTALAARLRQGDIDELHYFNGNSAEDELMLSFRNAKLCFTLKDLSGTPAAMFGVGWTPNPRVGRMWLLSTEFIYSVGRPFLMQCPFYVGLCMHGHDALFNFVFDENLDTIKWIEWLGFKPTRKMPETGPQKKPFTEYVKFSNEAARSIYLGRDWPPILETLPIRAG